MTKFVLWAVAVAGIAVAGIVLMQRVDRPETHAAGSGQRPPFPAASPADAVQQWACPADPAKWLGGQAAAEVIETPERWQEYLAVSGFQPPAPVDMARSRVALVPFIGGGGRRLESVVPARSDGHFEVVVTVRDSHQGTGPRPQDVSYDCRMVVVPRGAGPLGIRVDQAGAEPPKPPR